MSKELALRAVAVCASVGLSIPGVAFSADRGTRVGNSPTTSPKVKAPKVKSPASPGAASGKINIRGVMIDISGLSKAQLECVKAISSLTKRGYSAQEIMEYNLGAELTQRLQAVGAGSRRSPRKGGCQDLIDQANSSPPVLDDGPRQALPKPSIEGSIRVENKQLSSLTYRLSFPQPKSGMVYGDPVQGENNSRKWPVWRFRQFEARLKPHGCNINEDRSLSNWLKWTQVAASSIAKLNTRDLAAGSLASGKICLQARAIGTGNAKPLGQIEIPVSMPYSEQEIATAQKPFVVLGFGDSYGSGEGNPTQFRSGTLYNISGPFRPDPWRPNTFTSDGSVQAWWTPSMFSRQSLANDPSLLAYTNFCHRSSASGIGKAVQKLEKGSTSLIPQNVRFGHFACSGATSRHIFDARYRGNYLPATESRLPDYQPQVTVANQWLKKHKINKADVNAIVVSIGGNDAGFSTLIKDCILFYGSCSTTPSTISLKNNAKGVATSVIESMGSRLAREYPNAQIYFTAYPDGMANENGGVCSKESASKYRPAFNKYPDDPNWDIEKVDAKFLQDTQKLINSGLKEGVIKVNQQLRASGSTARVTFIDEHTKVNAHGFCVEERRIMLNDEARLVQGSDYTPKTPDWFAVGIEELARKIYPNIPDVDYKIFLKQPLYSAGGWHPNNAGYNAYGDAIYGWLKYQILHRQSSESLPNIPPQW